MKKNENKKGTNKQKKFKLKKTNNKNPENKVKKLSWDDVFNSINFGIRFVFNFLKEKRFWMWYGLLLISTIIVNIINDISADLIRKIILYVVFGLIMGIISTLFVWTLFWIYFKKSKEIIIAKSWIVYILKTFIFEIYIFLKYMLIPIVIYGLILIYLLMHANGNMIIPITGGILLAIWYLYIKLRVWFGGPIIGYYIIKNKKIGIVDAEKKSMNLTKGVLLKLIVFAIIMYAIIELINLTNFGIRLLLNLLLKIENNIFWSILDTFAVEMILIFSTISVLDLFKKVSIRQQN